MSYTHLQVRSGFSLMNSTITIEKLVAKAKELNFSALALTDEQVLYGVIPFYQACIKAGIKPLIGMVVNIINEDESEMGELVLLAKNNNGYQNLMKLSSSLQMENLGGIELEELSSYTKEVIGILSVKDKLLSEKLDTDTFQNVNEYLRIYEKVFSTGEFYIGIEGETRESRVLKSYTEKFETKITALSDVHYLEEKDVHSYDCLQAMKHGNEWNMQLANPSLKNKHFKSEQEVVQELEGFWPESIAETANITEKCTVDFDFNKRLLPTFPLEAGKTAHQYLEEVCWNNLQSKYKEITPTIKKRLQYELQTIQTMEFSDYFLIIADIISFAKEQGIMVGPGRGSSAGSIVAYVLGITAVDPIEYNLLFERFLNPERQTMPDIDIDFSDERRDEVIVYVREKYGAEHVAQIITFGTFAARSLIRELIKTLAVDQQDAQFILKEMPLQSNKNIVEMVKDLPELSEYIKESQKLKLLFSIAIRLEGIPRHISTHAAGVVISETSLIEHVPLTTGTNETYLTQYPMNDLEAIGLLKMDFLGLKNLSLIERVMKSINYHETSPLTLEAIPEQDEKTFEMLRKGRTSGVFQLESQGMKRVLKDLKPTHFEDIVAVNALYRPGPMDFIPTYIARKQMQEKIDYPHSDLKPILEKTYGVLVYQEQIMQIAKQIAGFSLGEADILRRAVSKKNKQVMADEQHAFIQGCLDNGYDEKVASEIFSWIVRFSNYGFPRSHAVAYSKISYQLSYLKAHYPANFFAEILSTARNQQDKINLYMKEMNEIGLELLPPSINKSYGRFTVEKGKIRMGLNSIKGIGKDTIKEISEVRKSGRYKNLFDFTLRISNKLVKRSHIENLIMAGGLDEIRANRASLLASIDQAMEQGELFKEFNDESSLFQNQIELVERYVDIEDFTITKKLQDEKELLGMYVSSHPLKNYRNKLRKNGFVSITDTEHLAGKKNIKGAAIVQEIKQIRTKRGEQMAFLTLADESMTIDAVLFPDRFREVKRWLEEEMLIFLKGKVERRNHRLQWVIDNLHPFSENELAVEPEKVLFIKSTKETNDKAIKIIQTLANEHPGDTPIILYDEEKKQSYRLAASYFLNPTGEALQQLNGFFGRGNVVIRKHNA